MKKNMKSSSILLGGLFLLGAVCSCTQTADVYKRQGRGTAGGKEFDSQGSSEPIADINPDVYKRQHYWLSTLMIRLRN